ncbi:MAG: phage GP46 family protein [Pseudomonadota bacterium]
MDLRTRFDNEHGEGDWLLAAPGLATDEGLETAVIISLFTDRRADPSDEIPDGTQDRRGWFGDAYADVPGDRIGSRLWLLSRAKQTAETLQRARDYAREALAWLIEDGIARAVEVDASWFALGRMALEVTISRAESAPARFRFIVFWDQPNAL